MYYSSLTKEELLRNMEGFLKHISNPDNSTTARWREKGYVFLGTINIEDSRIGMQAIETLGYENYMSIDKSDNDGQVTFLVTIEDRHKIDPMKFFHLLIVMLDTNRKEKLYG